jgi:4'-phosphopantetheinyl transferase
VTPERKNGSAGAVLTALRQLLGRYTDRDPSSLRFAYGRAGKPKLLDAPKIHFSVSHSGELTIVALARNTPVGVDVEGRRRPFRAGDVADRLFHAEEKRQLTALPEDELPAAVLRCWTIKEAVGKAIGLSLDELLRDVVVDADPAAPPRLLSVGGECAPERWSLNQLSLVDDHAMVAVAAPTPEVRFEPVRRFHSSSGSGHPAPTT